MGIRIWCIKYQIMYWSSSNDVTLSIVHCSFRICNYYWCTTCIHVRPSVWLLYVNENLQVVLLFMVCYDGCVTYQIINKLSSAYAIVCNFHCSFWICYCYSCVIVSFLVILRGSVWYTVRPIYFQPFWINYGVTWLQKKISNKYKFSRIFPFQQYMHM